MRNRDYCEMHWSIRLAATGKRKPIPLPKEVWRQFRLFKRNVKLRRLRKKLRVP